MVSVGNAEDGRYGLVVGKRRLGGQHLHQGAAETPGKKKGRGLVWLSKRVWLLKYRVLLDAEGKMVCG